MPIQYTCLHCGNTFFADPCDKRKYCSRRCHYQHRMVDRDSFVDRFNSHIDRSGECWIWTGTRHTFGYGQIIFGGKTLLAHRVAWEIENGPIPHGMSVLHTCDNPPCVNPGHLFLGTQADNIFDMESKGRARKVGSHGETNGSAILSASDVRSIRRWYASGRITQREIAEAYGVHRTTISLITRRKKWQHIP